ncbi:UDP-N-acetylmuramoyl-L-alanine--D-glutamate ligase [Shewanella sp. VB17]|uniref:UDP-N-acetylmuramoyl-L-alanine--D-glutamate ligase n=1 Tax=Shewanella sp. VB17 TaxID=2739432 RepID=UPI001565A2CC|nr:UDP-N-acetylmuramoyl-L-alanine--D-glutamate ligase [Shewanella sp. VB17]NRD75855.1 UDP-N-acetylmuramoyl-L-alanine--D-glutamate ligase [Shewanella sp. VB17]
MEKTKSHVVLGLGATGLSVVRYLCEQGISPLVMDSRYQPPGMDELTRLYPHVEFITGGFDCRYLVQAKQIIISPGIAVDTPEICAALDMGIEVIGDVELFARAIKDREPCVIGITGSNGKSTVTTLVGEMAQKAGLNYAVGGNIGVPVLDLLKEPKDLYILELSSFQLETTQSLNCIVATCLNISEDHMDRYTDLESYRQAKLSLYDQSKCALFNRDDQLTKPKDPMNLDSFGLSLSSDDGWGMNHGKLLHGSSEIMNLHDVALVGQHNHVNLLAAMALAYHVGIDNNSMIQVAMTFTGLAHRCELVAVHNGVSYVNDSKATNVGATVAALEGLSAHLGGVILIAGGDGKGADFRPLTSAIQGLSYLITLGKDGDEIATFFDGAMSVNSMSDAVKKASSLAKAGDIVLMSPACASLDMYDNFMARGEDFRTEVNALNNEQFDA